MDLNERLAKKQEEYKEVLTQLQTLDQRNQQLQQEYQKTRDGLLTKGIEIQGQIKLLQDMLPKPEEVK